MEKETTSEFIELYNEWKDHYKKLEVNYKNFLEMNTKKLDLNVRMRKTWDAKTLHPLPKN